MGHGNGCFFVVSKENILKWRCLLVSSNMESKWLCCFVSRFFRQHHSVFVLSWDFKQGCRFYGYVHTLRNWNVNKHLLTKLRSEIYWNIKMKNYKINRVQGTWNLPSPSWVPLNYSLPSLTHSPSTYNKIH